MTRICKIIKDDMWVEYNNEIIKVSVKGVFRNQSIKPLIGDYVKLEWVNNEPIINEILPRLNQLIRPSVVNVDIVILVQSTIEPNFNSSLIDKMLCSYAIAGAKAIVALTKTDLQYSEKIKLLVKDYKMMNYQIFDVNNENEYNEMISLFKDKVICFIGNSGVGKSTLINRINPALNIRTQEISKALNRGKHTTTNTTIIKCDGYYVVDTPGYSSIEIDISKHSFAHNFFGMTLAEGYCRYNDCFHLTSNIECIVKNYVESGKITQWRYQNYLDIITTLESNYDKPKFK